MPDLDESFVKKAKKLKVAHRGDGSDDWMIGTVNKHKLTERTTADGKSKKAKIEFRIAIATETAWFRLSKKDYGAKGEWALFKAKKGKGKKVEKGE